MIHRAKEKGFKVVLLFFWLRSIELAKVRVATRVKEGGHNIPLDVIERRYKSGITNLFHIYLSLVDEWFLYDNSNLVTELIAEKTREKFVIIYNIEKWQLLNQVL
jgi:predicted ABC-type ATPase